MARSAAFLSSLALLAGLAFGCQDPNPTFVFDASTTTTPDASDAARADAADASPADGGAAAGDAADGGTP